VVSTTKQIVPRTCQVKRVDLKALKQTLLKEESDFSLHFSNRRVSSVMLTVKNATVCIFRRSRRGLLGTSDSVCGYLYPFL